VEWVLGRVVLQPATDPVGDAARWTHGNVLEPTGGAVADAAR
jgi:hypothetical protein